MADTDKETGAFETIKGDLQTVNKTINNFSKQHITTTKSIIKRTKDSIFYFPVYCSKSLTINEAHALAKMLERVYADFVQNALYQHRIIEEDDFNDLKFLKKVHTNVIDEGTKCLDRLLGCEALDETEQMIYNSCYNLLKTHNGYMEIVESDSMFKDRYFVAEHERCLAEPLKGLYYLSEDNHYSSKEARERSNKKIDQLVKELKDCERKIKQSDEYIKDYKSWKAQDGSMSAEHMKNKYGLKQKGVDIDKQIEERYLYEKDHTRVKWEERKKEIAKEMEQLEQRNVNTDKLSKEEQIKENNRKEENLINTKEIKLITNTDIQKINSMLPYNINITVLVKTSRTENVVEQSYQIGIKTILHLVSPNDLEHEIPSIFKGSKSKFDDIRLKTGELNWMQWLFKAKENKEEAKNAYKNKTWVTTLKKLAKYKDTYGGTFKGAISFLTGFKRSQAPIPNATMILTAIDVDNIKLNTGIDLTKVSTVKTLAQNMFLITFVIMDSSTRTLRTLYPDSQNSWSTHALDAIEDLVAKSSNVDFMRELKKSINR